MQRWGCICTGLAGLGTFQWSCGKTERFECEDGVESSDSGGTELLPAALVDGFQVPQFQMARDVEAGTFVLVPPSISEVLMCAVFTANPKFKRPERISNAAEVIARYQLFSVDGAAPTLSFALAAFDHPDADTFQSCGVPPARYRVEGLSLGCWAMDDTRIIGATRLLELALSELPQTQPPVGSCLAENLADTAGRLCAVDAQFGVCRDGVCQAGASDASAPVGSPLRTCTLPSNGEGCVLIAPTGLGRCRSGLCVQEPGAALPSDQLVISCADTSAAAPRDGFSCLQQELGTFGTCFRGRCRQRCGKGVDDCRPTVGQFRGTLADEVSCAPLDAAKVSVCVQPEELP